MNNIAPCDPCAGFDFDPRSPYYAAPASPYTGWRCRICGERIREDEGCIDNGEIEIHQDCFTEMPPTFTLARLGWKKVEPCGEICAICGEPIEPNEEGYEPDEDYEKDGKHIHLSCFREQDRDDVLTALGFSQ